jgi:argininosuccinate synthase
VRDFVFPMFRANAIYEGVYLLGTALARPVLAKEQERVARATGADALAHGCTGKGHDQLRFELAYHALAPELQIVAPWREWEMRGRTELLTYAQKFEIPVSATLKKPYSMDRNLYHISYEGGVLEDPWREPDEAMYEWTTAPQRAPDEPGIVDVAFESGVPVAVNGARLGPVDLLTEMNRLGAAHGVGRVDLVEDRAVGMKARGVYETPGGTPLLIAHRAIESLTLDKEVMLERDRLSPRIAQLIYNGLWFSPEMDLLRAFVQRTQRHVTGTVRLRLFKGSVAVLGRKSPASLYREDIATFEADTSYDQRDATGFIRLNALRLKLRDQDS